MHQMHTQKQSKACYRGDGIYHDPGSGAASQERDVAGGEPCPVQSKAPRAHFQYLIHSTENAQAAVPSIFKSRCPAKLLGQDCG